MDKKQKRVTKIDDSLFKLVSFIKKHSSILPFYAYQLTNEIKQKDEALYNLFMSRRHETGHLLKTGVNKGIFTYVNNKDMELTKKENRRNYYNFNSPEHIFEWSNKNAS